MGIIIDHESKMNKLAITTIRHDKGDAHHWRWGGVK